MPIGYDDVQHRSYSVMAGFSPTGGGELEYYLCIVEADHENDSEHELWSGRDTASFMSAEQQENVLQAALYATDALIRLQKPARVFCCTHDSDLPEKALRKHYLIAEVFKMCGYTVDQLPVQLGKHSWWMERNL